MFVSKKVATLSQSNSLSAIFLYVHFCLTTGQKHWHSSIFWHSSVCRLSREGKKKTACTRPPPQVTASCPRNFLQPAKCLLRDPDASALLRAGILQCRKSNIAFLQLNIESLMLQKLDVVERLISTTKAYVVML